jgi:WD40 repeat protein
MPISSHQVSSLLIHSVVLILCFSVSLASLVSRFIMRSARSENQILTDKVKELSMKVKVLTLENQSLLAEVEIYRREALSGVSRQEKETPKHHVDSQKGGVDNMDHFFRSGNGVFPVEAVVTLHNLHGQSNPLCCALSRDDTILATGGADSHLNLCQWGAALAPGPDAARKVVQSSIRIPFLAPVICTSFCQTENLVAGGCMDGSLQVLSYKNAAGSGGLEIEPLQVTAKHAKYVKDMAWSPTEPILATASADGTITVSRVQQDKMETITTLHLPGTVETVCFSENGKSLFCYTRGTPYLSQFSLEDDFEQTKINLNAGVPGGGFEDHVSFAVMDIAVRGKHLALATDASRNIILDYDGGTQVRNLYGHQNDGFSQPKLGFSNNGQYILGNTQEDSSICVWDIASTTIVKRLEGHGQPVRALYSSPYSDTLVTTSFDKTTKIWLRAA